MTCAGFFLLGNHLEEVLILLDKNTNIYFSLSPVSEVIKSYLGYPPNRAMLVVSNLETQYYNQIYDSDIIPKYRISDLTVDKINNFAKKTILLSL